MKDTTKDLLRSLKMTAGSRFNAGKRMEKHDRRLTFLTAMTSAYVIALTVLPYFIKLPVPVTDHLNLFTVVLSVVILISSLLQYSSNNTVKAEQYH
ncbi:SLATT domain-containing protein [Mesorhizobium sp. CA15]